MIQAGQPLFAIVQVSDVWITANFKETQLAKMKAGPARGRSRSTPTAGASSTDKSTASRPRPAHASACCRPENATGNFVKVVQRIPVKIVLDKGEDADFALRPGMSVTPTVYTGKDS